MEQKITREDMVNLLTSGQAGFYWTGEGEGPLVWTLKHVLPSLDLKTISNINDLVGVQHVFVDKQDWNLRESHPHLKIYPSLIAIHLLYTKDEVIWNGHFVDKFRFNGERAVIKSSTDERRNELREALHSMNGILDENINENTNMVIVSDVPFSSNTITKLLLPHMLRNNINIVSGNDLITGLKNTQQERSKPLNFVQVYVSQPSEPLCSLITTLGGKICRSIKDGVVFALSDNSYEPDINAAKSKELYLINEAWLQKLALGNCDNEHGLQYPKPGPELDRTFRGYNIQIKIQDFELTQEGETFIMNDGGVLLDLCEGNDKADRVYVEVVQEKYCYFHRTQYCLIALLQDTHGEQCHHTHYPFVGDLKIPLPYERIFILCGEPSIKQWLFSVFVAANINCYDALNVSFVFIPKSEAIFWDKKTNPEVMLDLYRQHDGIKVFSVSKLAERSHTHLINTDNITDATWLKVAMDFKIQNARQVNPFTLSEMIYHAFLQLVKTNLDPKGFKFNFKMNFTEDKNILLSGQPVTGFLTRDMRDWSVSLVHVVMTLVRDICGLKPLCINFADASGSEKYTFICTNLQNQDKVIGTFYQCDSAVDEIPKKTDILLLFSVLVDLCLEKENICPGLKMLSCAIYCGKHCVCNSNEITDSMDVNCGEMPENATNTHEMVIARTGASSWDAYLFGEQIPAFQSGDLTLRTVYNNIAEMLKKKIEHPSKYPCMVCDDHSRNPNSYFPIHEDRRQPSLRCVVVSCGNIAKWYVAPNPLVRAVCPTNTEPPSQLAITN